MLQVFKNSKFSTQQIHQKSKQKRKKPHGHGKHSTHVFLHIIKITWNISYINRTRKNAEQFNDFYTQKYFSFFAFFTFFVCFLIHWVTGCFFILFDEMEWWEVWDFMLRVLMIPDALKCFKINKNASKCFKLNKNALKCFKILQIKQ